MMIPSEWWEYYNKPAYFITYFGEIYHGIIMEVSDFPDSFFIVQLNKVNEFKKLKSTKEKIEEFIKIGREIKDVDVIKEVLKDDFINSLKINGSNTYRGERFNKMFVFGAAASTFCVFKDSEEIFRNSSVNPPTGFEIFDEKYEEIYKNYRGAMASIPFFEYKNKDIEGCLNEEWNLYKNSYNPEIAARHINIQFYLQKLTSEISKGVKSKFYRKNLYSLFLNKLQKIISKNHAERVSIVSFNYDTIIEDFATDIFNYSFDNINDYVDYKNRKILFFKPHGSCNWGWKMKFYPFIDDIVQLATELYKNKAMPSDIFFNYIGKPIDVIANNSWGYEESIDENYRGKFIINKDLIEIFNDDEIVENYFPSILIPYRDKDDFMMPYKHWDILDHSKREIKELYLIGWKGNERLFNQNLAKNSYRLKKLIIVNPCPDEVINNLKKHIDLSKVEIIKVNDFESFVLEYFDENIN